MTATETKVRAYRTIMELFSSDLDIEVEKALNDGWELHGHQFIAPCHNTDIPGTYISFHCQVVVNEAPF